MANITRGPSLPFVLYSPVSILHCIGPTYPLYIFETAHGGILRLTGLVPGGVRSDRSASGAAMLQLGGLPYREPLFLSFGEITTPKGGIPTRWLPRWLSPLAGRRYGSNGRIGRRMVDPPCRRSGGICRTRIYPNCVPPPAKVPL